MLVFAPQSMNSLSPIGVPFNDVDFASVVPLNLDSGSVVDLDFASVYSLFYYIILASPFVFRLSKVNLSETLIWRVTRDKLSCIYVSSVASS